MNSKRRNRIKTGLVLTAGLLAAALTGCGSGSADKVSMETAEMAYEDLRIAEDKNDELQNQISNLKDKASESVSSIIKERQDYKILKDKVENLSAECDYLKRVINLQLRNNVEVWRLEDISNTKPIVLKLQENIGNEIIVRIERG